jgi:hypothetical protein
LKRSLQTRFTPRVTDDHCRAYGATLLGMLEAGFYEKICGLADFVGAEFRLPGNAAPACAGACA